MPALGMAQETGTLIRWLKAVGEAVAKGEPLMEIETDKATVEIEAPAAGVLANVSAQAGDVVPVGQTIAVLLAPGEAAPTAAKAPAKRQKDLTPPAPLPAVLGASSPLKEGGSKAGFSGIASSSIPKGVQASPI